MKVKFSLTSAILVSGLMWTPIGSSAAVTPMVGDVEFDEPFADPRDALAKELVKISGVTLSEAKRQLRLENESSRLIAKLRQRYSTYFAGSLIVRNRGDYHINIYFANADLVTARSTLSALGASPELMANLLVGKAAASEAATTAKAVKLARQLHARGIKGTASFVPFAAKVKLEVENPAEAAKAVQMGLVEADKTVEIVKFEGIEPTQAGPVEMGGGQWHNQAPYTTQTGDCTGGFSVRERSTNTYGISTAAHCPNSAVYTGEHMGTPGNNLNLGFKQEWRGDGLDIQWATLAVQGYLIVPKFWNGGYVETVYGGEYPQTAELTCKYGRRSGQSCGYVDASQYVSVDAETGFNYGPMWRINNNPLYATMIRDGDSGGPVFRGGMAVGIVHGEDRNPATTVKHVYFMPIYAMQTANLPISITCQC